MDAFLELLLAVVVVVEVEWRTDEKTPRFHFVAKRPIFHTFTFFRTCNLTRAPISNLETTLLSGNSHEESQRVRGTR